MFTIWRRVVVGHAYKSLGEILNIINDSAG